MGIFSRSDIDEIQKLSFQYNNMWEFFIVSPVVTNNVFENKMKFRVKSINLPRFKLTTEKLTSGEIAYTGYEFENTVSMTIMETTDMKTYEYFQNWQDFIFDKKTMRFKTFPKNSPNVFRKGILKLHKYQANPSVILSTILNSSVRNLAEPRARAGVKVPPSTNPVVNNITKSALSGTSIITNRSLTEVGRSLIPQVTKKQTGIFLFNNLKFVNIEDSEFDYDNAEPLSYTVNMEVESITYESGKNLPLV